MASLLGIYQSQAMIITQMISPSQVVIFVVTYKVVALPMELVYMGTVKLPRFRGHRTIWVRGVHDGQDKSSLPA
jgi:hypothetical protein